MEKGEKVIFNDCNKTFKGKVTNIVKSKIDKRYDIAYVALKNPNRYKICLLSELRKTN